MAQRNPQLIGRHPYQLRRHGLVPTPTARQIMFRIGAVVAVCTGFVASLIYLVVQITP